MEEQIQKEKESIETEVKRISSAIIIFSIVAIILIWGNKYLVDLAIAIVAIMSLHEYFQSFKAKGEKPITWIGYLAALSIAVVHVIPPEFAIKTIGFILPVSILLLFLQVIITNMKFTIKDVAITSFGICYIVVFLMYISIIREMPNGKWLIWFVMLSAWGTDIFAYLIGKTWGKHRFTKISPHKSIEGSIAGIMGAVVAVLLYTIACNNIGGLNINYIYIAVVAVLFSIIGQIGDLAASSIKRYTGIKDFSNLIPGHGGMLDRIDSVIFIAPFAYFLLMFI